MNAAAKKAVTHSAESGTRETALAVAIADRSPREPAPRIIASGRGKLAEQILEIAFANDVKVREDADLVQILATLEVESLVPLEALTAVAEILAYIYLANAARAAKETS